MIGPLHLGQAITHMGYNVLCLCCCDEVPETGNLGGSSFGTESVISVPGLNPFVTQTPSNEIPTSQNPIPLATVQANFKDRVNKFLNSDTIAPRRTRSYGIDPLVYKIQKSYKRMEKREEDEFLIIMLLSEEGDDCCDC